MRGFRPGLQKDNFEFSTMQPLGGDVTVKSWEVGRVERLGGIGETIAA